MDVTGWLLRRAVPCAFVVTAIGGTGARLAVERALRERGWRQALAPAETDLLVVCGPVDPELDEMLDRVWAQMPDPRARVHVESVDSAIRLLDEAHGDLIDLARQRREATERDRAARERASSDHDDDGEAPMHGEETPMHGGETHMHGGEMSMPGGIPMADRSEDRDGLMLDQLHIVLGPALPDWPAGLSLRLTLQGDVVQEAETSIVGGSASISSFWDASGVDSSAQPSPGLRGAAAALDSAQRFLAVVGWSAAASTGCRLRDALLEGSDSAGAARCEALRWLRRVRRSRMLRWSTDRLGRVTDGAPQALCGDTTDRWSRWLDTVEKTLTEPNSSDAQASASRGQVAHAALELLPSLVVGQELAAVRIIVASLDPDTETVGAYTEERRHG